MRRSPYHFSLEALLRVRKIKERLSLGELAKILVEYNVYQKEILAKEAEMKKNKSEYVMRYKALDNGLDDKGVQIEGKKMWDSYFKRIANQIIIEKDKASQITPQLEKKRAELIIARQKSKVLELLKEEESIVHFNKFQKKERIALTEINQRRKKLEIKRNFVL